MRLKNALCFICLFLGFAFNGFSQDNEKVLFTVNGTPAFASEFVRVYNKNLDLVQDESQKNVAVYLKLFIQYKLKLAEARKLKLDEAADYVKELDGYKKQLAKNFIFDTEVTEELVNEAYFRLKNEVAANHILIMLDASATPQDTLTAYNTLLNIRNDIKTYGFNAVKQKVHNGKTVFAEDLGYFTALKMVYEFENIAYTTPVGEVSMPFKTRFGYHIVNVLDKRKTKGEITVGHIMIKNDASKVREIYKRIQQGEEFESLAKQFSEDPSSSDNGGKLKPFSSGALSSSQFEDAAFNIKTVGDITEPIKSEYGWHIIKLYEKKGIPPLSDLKNELISKIKRDSRSQLINASRLEGLKARYTINEETADLSYFVSILTPDFLKRKWVLPSDFKAEKMFLKIEDKQFKNSDFGTFLVGYQYRNLTEKDGRKWVEQAYKTFLELALFKYQEDHLINENKEYANIIGEYRDGILLFNLMQTEIWNAAKNDSLGLKNYYDTHKNKYVTLKTANAIVASSAEKRTIKSVAKALKKETSVTAIKKELNTKNIIAVSFTIGDLEIDHQAFPKKLKIAQGVSKVYKHNDAYVVVKIEGITEAKQKNYKESKGQVISDYQAQKEKEWLVNLANSYTIKINDDVLKDVNTLLKPANN
ncbi:peptidylprolyl isomerase [Bizionia saleffrena]|uniref:peptidylprolyl isomerase n=1 Tax=Bizionia saleffrena TaxID=291189 RepID=A0A8H2QGF7_9FLAO|nr:peptidylprolyl isomerase [Bizionia saleffrena]TYB80101.1 peptidylprolyl isomerase [Bizionia saleffrena]